MQVHHKDIKPGRVTLSGTVILTVEQGESGIVFGLSDGRRLTNRPDDTWDVFPESISGTFDRPSAEDVKSIANDLYTAVTEAKGEILTDIRKRVVSPAVFSFSDLHNFVDANEYGGLTDPAVFGSEKFATTEEWIAFGNGLQDEVDAWIKADGIEEALGADYRSLLAQWDEEAGDDVEDRVALVFTIDVTALTPEQRGHLEAAVSAQLDDGTEDYPAPASYASATLDHDSERDIISAVQVGLGH